MLADIPEVAPIKFKGKAGEWFGIWIVNLLLSILTIGIYSAWAKVRRKKYFYQNTYIAGRNFDYHATGSQILIGRIIVIAAYFGFQVIAATAPLVGGILALLFVIAIPWLIMRSMMFNARNSSWSNVRFGFTGKTGGAVLAYIVFPFLSVFTLFLTWPLVEWYRANYKYAGHRLGQSKFALDASGWGFYRAFILAGAWVVFVLGAAIILSLPYLSQLDMLATNPDDFAANFSIIFAFTAIVFVGFIPAGVIHSALIRNTVYNGLVLGDRHRFRSNISAGRMLWISFSNLVAVALSVGLLLPWAHIRLTRYLADHTVALPIGSLDDFVATEQRRAGPVGDAYTDFEGIDVGI